MTDTQDLLTRLEEAEAAFWKEYGASVQERRNLAGLTQFQLAAELGVSRPTIANIEGGRTRVTLWQDRAICNVVKDQTTALRLKKERLTEQLQEVDKALKARKQ